MRYAVRLPWFPPLSGLQRMKFRNVFCQLIFRCMNLLDKQGEVANVRFSSKGEDYTLLFQQITPGENRKKGSFSHVVSLTDLWQCRSLQPKSVVNQIPLITYKYTFRQKFLVGWIVQKWRFWLYASLSNSEMRGLESFPFPVNFVIILIKC